MTKKKDKKEYQKPELVHIDDPAFDETGQGDSRLPGGGGGGTGGGGHGGGGGGH